VELTIEKLVYGGDGLARLPADEHGRGKAVFVPFVLPGEKIEAELSEQRPGFARARAEKMLQASAHRTQPQCPYFGQCGGCHYQHASYEYQLELKAAILRENLRRIAKLELANELIVHASPPWEYRNRTRLRVQTAPQFALGYYKLNSHELLPVERCPISSPLLNRAIAAVWEWGRAGGVSPGMQEIEFFADAEGEQLLLEAYVSPEVSIADAEVLAHELLKNLPQAVGATVFHRAARNTAEQSAEGPRRVAAAGSSALKYKTLQGIYQVSTGGFFQVNRYVIGKLTDIVSDGFSGQIALDLYAGVGLFALALAPSFAQVIAVEASQTSHADLLHNSGAQVKAVRARTEHYLQKLGRKLRADLVVVDPPRAGLGERVVQSLVELAAPRLAYVSCDPATLARDLAGLLRAGYRIEQAHLVDLFPQTYHIESVFHLAR